MDSWKCLSGLHIVWKKLDCLEKFLIFLGSFRKVKNHTVVDHSDQSNLLSCLKCAKPFRTHKTFCIVVWSWVNMGGDFAARMGTPGLLPSDPLWAWSLPNPAQNTTSFPPLSSVLTFWHSLEVGPSWYTWIKEPFAWHFHDTKSQIYLKSRWTVSTRGTLVTWNQVEHSPKWQKNVKRYSNMEI